jgi:hypothetical protein
MPAMTGCALAERMEDDDLVDPVDELRPELLFTSAITAASPAP